MKEIDTKKLKRIASRVVKQNKKEELAAATKRNADYESNSRFLLQAIKEQIKKDAEKAAQQGDKKFTSSYSISVDWNGHINFKALEQWIKKQGLKLIKFDTSFSEGFGSIADGQTFSASYYTTLNLSL